MTAEAILTELYENFQDGKYWDKALKKIEEYANQKVIEGRIANNTSIVLLLKGLGKDKTIEVLEKEIEELKQ